MAAEISPERVFWHFLGVYPPKPPKMGGRTPPRDPPDRGVPESGEIGPMADFLKLSNIDNFHKRYHWFCNRYVDVNLLCLYWFCLGVSVASRARGGNHCMSLKIVTAHPRPDSAGHQPRVRGSLLILSPFSPLHPILLYYI